MICKQCTKSLLNALILSMRFNIRRSVLSYRLLKKMKNGYQISLVITNEVEDKVRRPGNKLSSRTFRIGLIGSSFTK